MGEEDLSSPNTYLFKTYSLLVAGKNWKRASRRKTELAAPATKTYPVVTANGVDVVLLRRKSHCEDFPLVGRPGGDDVRSPQVNDAYGAIVAATHQQPTIVVHDAAVHHAPVQLVGTL